MSSRGRQSNLSFFAFTATPKGKTLELFGRMGASGLPEAFHLYCMRQAIEAGFILDVVKNYTTYTTYYRLQRIYAGEISLREGDPEGVKSPTDVGTGRAKEEKAPLSEIIEDLNDRFGTSFSEEDRFFFEQIREKAANNEQVIKLRQANPFDKFQPGLRQLIEDLMVARMDDNDKIVTRHMDDKDFGSTAFSVLSKAISESIPKKHS